MSILAQDFLDDHLPTGTPFDDHVIANLTLSTKLDKVAHRIVFDEDLYAVLGEMAKNGQLDFSMICRNTKMPASKLWIEWKDCKTQKGSLKFGILITQDQSGELLCVCVNSCKSHDLEMKARPQVSCVFKTQPPPYEKGVQQMTRLLWTCNDEKPDLYKEDMWKELNAMAIRTMVFAIFLLQQPKIIDQEKVEHSHKIQRKRKEKKKPELISYEKISMKFDVLGSRMGNVVRRYSGKGEPGNIKTIEIERNGVRYHYVLGHFRCYHRGEPNEHIIWINGHYRGDPAKGVLIRERTLTTAKGKADEKV